MPNSPGAYAFYEKITGNSVAEPSTISLFSIDQPTPQVIQTCSGRRTHLLIRATGSDYEVSYPCYKALYENPYCRIWGFVFFQLPFTPKNVKKKNVEFDALGGQIWWLLKIQSDFGSYFIYSCKGEIL